MDKNCMNCSFSMEIDKANDIKLCGCKDSQSYLKDVSKDDFCCKHKERANIEGRFI